MSYYAFDDDGVLLMENGRADLVDDPRSSVGLALGIERDTVATLPFVGSGFARQFVRGGPHVNPVPLAVSSARDALLPLQQRGQLGEVDVVARVTGGRVIVEISGPALPTPVQLDVT